MALLLHLLSYAVGLVLVAFVVFSVANGLLWIAELIEEHPSVAKVVGMRMTYCIIVLHVVLYFSEAFPLGLTAISLICHLVYLQNFSSTWPVISLTSVSFVLSCILVIADHFLWFFYFAHRAQVARNRGRHRYGVGGHIAKSKDGALTFLETTTFFGTCVWLIPVFLFLSLSANDNALPTADRGSSRSPSVPQHLSPAPRVPLLKRAFAILPKSALPRSMRIQEPIIAPPPRSPRMSPSPTPLPTTPGASWTDLSGLSSPASPYGGLNDGRQSPRAPIALSAPPRRHSSSPLIPERAMATSPLSRQRSSRMLTPVFGLGLEMDEAQGVGRRRPSTQDSSAD